MEVPQMAGTLKTLTPNLMVEDVAATLDWYGSVLGFAPVAEVPGEGEKTQFAIVRRDDIQLMFQSRKSLTSDLPVPEGAAIGAAQTFYIEVEDVEGLRQQVEGKVRIIKDLHDSFYGTREFYFTDCNGYILAFSQ